MISFEKNRPLTGAENQMLSWEREKQYDERVRQQREAEDAARQEAAATGTLPINDPGPTFTRMQQNTAGGPGGWSRQWIPFFEALRGSHVNMGSLNLPTSGYDANSNLVSRQAPKGSLEREGMPVVHMPKVTMPSVNPTFSMPESQDAWEARMKQQIYGLNAAKTKF